MASLSAEMEDTIPIRVARLSRVWVHSHSANRIPDHGTPLDRLLSAHVSLINLMKGQYGASSYWKVKPARLIIRTFGSGTAPIVKERL